MKRPLQHTLLRLPALTSKTTYRPLALVAWHIAYTALWNGKEFSKTEKRKALGLVCYHIEQGRNPLSAFSIFVQRVLLARQWLDVRPGCFAPIPSYWFCTAQKNGYPVTERWYASLVGARAVFPSYREPIKAFGDAILETLASDDPMVFHYWRHYFIKHRAQRLLNLYLSTLATCQNAGLTI